jgi:glycosyltransferase involved in cell wall biosynthesis
MRDERLAAAYASADVFVFPSLTDTFGLVLLEALASGLPVAANPVVGPLDVIGDSGAGILDANLGRAALAALSIPRELARARALTFSLGNLATICRRDRDPGFCSHKRQSDHVTSKSLILLAGASRRPARLTSKKPGRDNAPWTVTPNALSLHPAARPANAVGW